ncbi:tRNA(Met) cytidine acetate ligase [Fusobacterium sp. PH5-44]|uniref:tRNA(Met) cytidine acetate ligase n=1 Tax=unclassified Fusobacterium TaxID=2648384 RepID=UPI003D1AAA8D
MKSTGLIVEYNPFHNGHLYHLEKSKEITPDSVKIAVMSGDFVQRGEPAFVKKEIRARMAVLNGVDIVVELPVFYSCQSAEIFAIGAVGILEQLKCSEIVFGSERDNIEELEEIGNIIENMEFKIKMKEALKIGESYINAYKIASNGKYDLNSNDILGVEYIKAIKYWNSAIAPKVIKRNNASYYDEAIYESITSGFNLRKLMINKSDINGFVPNNVMDILLGEVKEGDFAVIEDFYPYIRYKIIDNKASLVNIQDMENGFENRLYKCAVKNDIFSEFFNNIMSKRLSIGRTQRILMHILLDLTNEITEEIKKEIPFIKILDYNKKGQEYLNFLKKNEVKKFFTTFKNITKKFNSKDLQMINFNEKANIIYKMKNYYRG